MRRPVSAALVGIVLLFATALPALAHAHLLGGMPADGSSVAEAPALVLHFSEPVEPAFTGVVLKDPAGTVVATGSTQADAGDPATITVAIPAKLAPGRYEVDWHALAVDGHKTTGSYAFSVMP